MGEGSDLPDTDPLDLMPQLQRSGPSIVKTRSGSVLSRGVILKTDHYPSGASSHSFRSAAVGDALSMRAW